jgi:uncharacterized protein
MDLTPYAQELMVFYRELSLTFSQAQKASGLSCPPECGRCCNYPEVEAIPFELIPLAMHLVKSGLAEQTLEKLAEGNHRCVSFQALSPDGSRGRCTQYEHRPFLCRVFAVAGTKNKFGDPVASVCSTLKTEYPEWEQVNAADLPLMQQWSFKLRQIHPRLNETSVSINTALQQALAIVMLYESFSQS